MKGREFSFPKCVCRDLQARADILFRKGGDVLIVLLPCAFLKKQAALEADVANRQTVWCINGNRHS